jgi:hypothetical protein
MKLDAALKVSLDELRMQMLGAQVLLGFEFQGRSNRCSRKRV